MKTLFRISLQIAVVLTLSTAIFAQAAKRSSFDVTNYVISAELSPVEALKKVRETPAAAPR